MHMYKTVATDAWGSVFEDEVWAESPYKAADIAADGLVNRSLKGLSRVTYRASSSGEQVVYRSAYYPEGKRISAENETGVLTIKITHMTGPRSRGRD